MVFIHHFGWLPSIKTHSLLLKMAIEIVDFPIDSMVMLVFCKRLPEGNFFRWWDNFLKNVAMEKPPAATTALLPLFDPPFREHRLSDFGDAPGSGNDDTFIWEIPLFGRSRNQVFCCCEKAEKQAEIFPIRRSGFYQLSWKKVTA